MKHFTTVFKENKSIFLEFALIFAFFILPPLIQGPSVGGKISIAGGGKLSASIFVQLILTALLLLQNKFKPILPVEKKGSPLILFLMWTPICLGLCMISQAAVTGISMAIKIDAGGGYIFPASAAGWAIYFVNLAIGVVYEETIYRLFLPDTMILLAGEKKSLRITLEAICVAVFAFSHRYLGAMALVNAAICGTALRFGKIKSGRIYAPMAAHLLYNIFQTIILYLLVKP
ncbi:MAG: CPBP family intramembrane metalloprotease [Treponema sp.]|nr:CPBP family intramembrane metalloprotease [Treponema sp.]